MSIRVTIWNEFRHEKEHDAVKAVYPKGIHVAIADYLKKNTDFKVKTAWLDKDEEHGLSDKILASTDVLTWWGHMAHGDVKDEIVEKVQQRVLDGMGLIVLHSGHYSKIFRKLMGTSCSLKWREINERERMWVVAPGHPIVAGLPEYIEIPHVEMYGEHFDIPAPDDLVLISWFQGGEVFRSGCCFNRGKGKIFYFRPGHETLPIYYHEQVMQILANSISWAAPTNPPALTRDHYMPLEKVVIDE